MAVITRHVGKMNEILGNKTALYNCGSIFLLGRRKWSHQAQLFDFITRFEFDQKRIWDA
jgi:hypothetical protein